MGKRGRPKKRSGGANEEEIVTVERQDPTEDILYSPAHKYGTRLSGTIHAKWAANSSRPLRSAVRCVTRASHGNSSMTSSEENESNNLTQELEKSAKQHPPGESVNVAVKNVNLENSPSKPIFHSRVQSLNITEFAKMLEDEIEDDPEEIQSDFDPAFGYVGEHKVKIEMVPLLRKIFDKYGDITKECTVTSPRYLSFAFESLCYVMTKLEQTTFKDVTRIALEEMLNDVHFLEETMKVNVGWLRQRLESISQAKDGLQEYLQIKKEEAKYDASISELQKKITAMEGEREATRKRAHEIRAAVDTFRKQTLVHGVI